MYVAKLIVGLKNGNYHCVQSVEQTAEGTERPGGRGALRESGAGEPASATRRSRRTAVRCGEPGLRRSRSCGRCAGRPRRSL